MLKPILLLVALGVVAACEDEYVGTVADGQESYFATNIGKSSGYAKAFAARCPTIGFNEDTMLRNRIAICEAQTGQAQNCALPNLESAQATSMANTIASLANLPDAQVCAQATAQAQTDPNFARYLTGWAPVVIAAPVVAPEPKPEPEEETF